MTDEGMNTTQILDLMSRIHRENIISKDQPGFSEEKLETVYRELNMTFKQVMRSLTFDFIDIAGVTNITPEWKFMCLNFYCLNQLNTAMKKDYRISVAQSKDLKKYLATMTRVGILQNLNPKLAHFRPFRSQEAEIETQYYMLKASVCGLFKYAMQSNLRYHLLPQVLQGLLVALFQLAYCPVKKPSSCKEGEFVMTEEFYSEVLGDQDRFEGFLQTIQNSVSPSIYLNEVMILFKSNAPNWFRKAVSSTLTTYIKQPKGLENIVKTMLAGTYDDIAVVGRVVDIITQIVLKTIYLEDFETSMGSQINQLLSVAKSFSNQNSFAFEKLYASIIKSIYSTKQELTTPFLNFLFVPFKELSGENDNNYTDNNILADDIIQRVRIVHYIFLDTKDASIPLIILKPFIGVLFKLSVFVDDSNLTTLKSDLLDLIFEYMKSCDKSSLFQLLEKFIFDLNVSDILNFRRDIIISAPSHSLVIKMSKTPVKQDVIKGVHFIYSICKLDTKLFMLYFSFFLCCLCHPDKYFSDSSLLESEDEGNLSTFENKITVYEMLSILASDGMVNNYFTEQIPDEVLDYFNQVFITVIETGAHKIPGDAMFQVVFTMAMILEGVSNSKELDLGKSGIKDSIETIYRETTDQELKILLKKVLENPKRTVVSEKQMDEVEEAIQETFNESIPMKGHGLIALEKLIKARQPKAVERKQYIFTIFKENLSNSDTYIYLSAIKGLASLADLGTHTTNMVLETLCDEYIEFRKEDFGPDSNEMRLKIGEILVQISKNLGELAPNFKSLLLNTFLNGTKHNDHLVRASALANLGEICRVLGFRLGPIVTEILTCIHAIITTDKCPEPRRAAVLVLRELLAGLGTDMLTVLKGEILICYRTIKFLYETDSDEVVKLQAQLALEELNNNMKDILFPQLEMSPEDKVVILK